MKTRVVLFLIGLGLLQSLLIFIATQKMNLEGLTPVLFIRFVILTIIVLVTSRSIGLTRIHNRHTESKLFRILNYVSLISTFIFSPLSGLLIGLIYFYFSDWPMNISAQNAGMNIWFVSVQMLVFLAVPITTMIVARIKWSIKKTNANSTSK